MKVASVEQTINDLTIRARELGQQNQEVMTERDALQEKAASIAAHVKALQAFKKNCQSFLECRDDLPDMPMTPEDQLAAHPPSDEKPAPRSGSRGRKSPWFKGEAPAGEEAEPAELE